MRQIDPQVGFATSSRRWRRRLRHRDGRSRLHRESTASTSEAVLRLRHGLDTLRLWQERARGRQQLRTFDDHLLRDIGFDAPAGRGRGAESHSGAPEGRAAWRGDRHERPLRPGVLPIAVAACVAGRPAWHPAVRPDGASRARAADRPARPDRADGFGRPRRDRARALGHGRCGHAAAAADHRTARAGLALGLGRAAERTETIQCARRRQRET